MQRSASFDVDRDFTAFCDVTKFTTLPDGRRLIRGVASGTVEDRDGERVSARAIAEMAAQGTRGIKVVAGTHAQDWTNEIGDAVALRHDPETDELIADAILPPAGKDALADKACNRLEAGEKLGWSIGGKLRKAYFELAEGPGGGVRKRKVLDSILLKHLCLTEKPSYANSVVTFAGEVAKTAKDFEADDSLPMYEVDPGDELRDAETIAKAAKPDDEPDPATAAPAAPAPDDAAPAPADGEAPPDDSAAAPPAATADPSQTEPSDAEAAQALPMSDRHLSCPNCGEEFAAPMPEDGPDAQDKTEAADQPPPPAVGKTSTQEHTKMDALLAQVDALREQIAAAASTENPVEKTATATEPTDVERMLAHVHKTATERADTLESGVKESLELVAKTVQTLAERINEMPQGRRSMSVAHTPAKPNVEVAKTTTDTDSVQKTAEDLAEAGDLTGALRALNAANGIR